VEHCIVEPKAVERAIWAGSPTTPAWRPPCPSPPSTSGVWNSAQRFGVLQATNDI